MTINEGAAVEESRSERKQRIDAEKGAQIAAAKVADDAVAAIAASVAPVVHEANRMYRIEIGENAGAGWDRQSPEAKASIIDGVTHRIHNSSAPLEVSHDRWMTRKLAEGWRHGAEKNEAKKTHPQLVPWADLPAAQRRKDALLAAITLALTADPTELA